MQMHPTGAPALANRAGKPSPGKRRSAAVVWQNCGAVRESGTPAGAAVDLACGRAGRARGRGRRIEEGDSSGAALLPQSGCSDVACAAAHAAAAAARLHGRLSQ